MKDLTPLFRTACSVALLATLVSCAKKEEPAAAPMALAEERSARQAADAPPPPPPEGAAAAVTNATMAQQLGSSAATYTDSERKFIRTAGAHFLVKDVYVAAISLEDITAAHGGFVVKNDISARKGASRSHRAGDGKLLELTAYTVEGHLVVRVPSAKTQEFLRAIAGHIVFLDERSFAARDAQFDLLRQQLEMIRSQETQSELGDAVKDGGKLTQKTEAIGTRYAVKAARDAALLAKKEFDDQVAFSTISLDLYQPSRVLQSETIDTERIFERAGPGFFSQLGDQLRGGWEGLQAFALWLAGIWPVLLIGGLLVPVVWRARSKRRASA